jgi:hypothetical protein
MEYAANGLLLERPVIGANGILVKDSRIADDNHGIGSGQTRIDNCQVLIVFEHGGFLTSCRAGTS